MSTTAPGPEPRPLSGLRVLEISQVLAGAFASMVLSDLGASVVKVERPGIGDPSRGYGPPFVDESAYYFHSLNRNKRSVALALDTKPGQEILRQLATRSDVLIHNLLPKSARSLGVTADNLRDANPDLVFAAVSAYGEVPGMDERPALDMLIQAAAGSMAMTGFEDGAPVKAAVPIADIAAGLFTAVAALAVVAGKGIRPGQGGAEINTSLMRSVVAALPFHWGEFIVDGRDPVRRGNGHPSIVPYNTYLARDGRHVAIAVSSDAHWRALCAELGLVELGADPGLARNRDRVARREHVERELARAFGAADAEELVLRLERARVPVALVNSPRDVAARSQADGWNLFGPQPHGSEADEVLTARPPFTVDGVDVPLGRAPRLGEHTREVLTELGVTDMEIEDLLKTRAIEAHEGMALAGPSAE